VQLMCETCRVMQQELSRRIFLVLLSRVAVTRAPAGVQFNAVKQLCDAELELRVAEDLYTEHQVKHLERMAS
jgi:hypothetical protein